MAFTAAQQWSQVFTLVRTAAICLCAFFLISCATMDEATAPQMTELLTRLEADQLETRTSALSEISVIGVAAVPTLLRQLVAGEPRSAHAAAVTLGVIRDRRAIAPLIWVLSSDSARLRWAASWALGEVGDQRAVPALSRLALSDDNAVVRKRAVISLWHFDYSATINPLIAMMHDPDERNRDFAYDSLARILNAFPGLSPEEPLMAMLSDMKRDPNSPDNQRTVLVKPALRLLTARGYTDASWKLLSGIALDRSQKIDTRRAAIEYVPLMKGMDQGSVAFLARMIFDPSENKSARIAAIRALSKVPGPESLCVLTEASALPESELAGYAVEALGDLGDRGAVESLIEHVSFTECAQPSLCSKAVVALGRIGDAVAVPVLLRILDPSGPIVPDASNCFFCRGYVVENAIEALGRIGDARAIPALLRAHEYDATADSIASGMPGNLVRIRTTARIALGKLDLHETVDPLVEAAARGDDGFVAAAIDMPADRRLVDVLALYDVTLDVNHNALAGAGEALARNGAFRFLPPPPVGHWARRYFSMGISAASAGNPSEARDYFERSLRQAPWWPAARYNLAETYVYWATPEVASRVTYAQTRDRAIDQFGLYLVLSPQATDRLAVQMTMNWLSALPKAPTRITPFDVAEADDFLAAMPRERAERKTELPRGGIPAADRKPR